MQNHDLITSAAERLRPREYDGRLFGDVASSLVTVQGNLYRGVCLDTSSGTGFCAEHSAIAAMVTAGEYEIARIVAVWRSPEGELFVLPPCGRCREFIRQIHVNNLQTEVVLAVDRHAQLVDLLPESAWPTDAVPGEKRRGTVW